jgi:enoyl-CoA hydratase
MEQLKHLKTNVDNKILLIQLNNPPVNALNSALMRELEQVLTSVADDENVRLLIITGEGKFFSAGADIKELNELLNKDFQTRKDFVLKNTAILDKIANFSKPVIAAINGYALGGGLELALACHLRFASFDAKIGLPEIDLGIFPGWEGIRRLLKSIGRPEAQVMISTGKIISGTEAKCLGIVNRATNHDKLLAGTKDFAKILIDKSQDALRCVLLAINKEMGREEIADLFAELLGKESTRKGISDFINKKR